MMRRAVVRVVLVAVAPNVKDDFVVTTVARLYDVTKQYDEAKRRDDEGAEDDDDSEQDAVSETG
jgi:hypothetical protein